MRRSELLIVAFVLAILHLALFAAHLPLAQRDLSAYMEPGIYLAQTGRLAGPSSQHQDLTSISGYYFYPPGYFLLIAAWVKMFGHDSDALLAFTGIAHFGFTLGLWTLVRLRMGATPFGAVLTIASVFAGFNHGRPDVVALMFGTLAWLAYGDKTWQLVTAGLLLAAACLNSPAHGLGACGAIAGFELARYGFRRVDLLRVVLLGGVTVAVGGVVVLIVLASQGSWELARVQWHIHSTIRGAELNSWPPLRDTYVAIFCLIPLVVLTLPSLFLALLSPCSNPATRPTAVGYLLGAGVQLYLVPADFLLLRHFTFVGRPAFQATLTTSSRWLRWAGYSGLAYYIVINTYFHKNHLWPLDNGRDRNLTPVIALELPNSVCLATDSQFFPLLYRRDRTIAYEIYRNMNRWEAHKRLTPPALFDSAVPLDRRAEPAEPDLIVVAAATVEDIGPLSDDRFVLLTPSNLPRRYRLFGRPIRLCSNPFAPVVYVRKDQLAKLLPAIEAAGFPIDQGPGQ